MLVRAIILLLEIGISPQKINRASIPQTAGPMKLHCVNPVPAVEINCSERRSARRKKKSVSSECLESHQVIFPFAPRTATTTRQSVLTPRENQKMRNDILSTT